MWSTRVGVVALVITVSVVVGEQLRVAREGAAARATATASTASAPAAPTALATLPAPTSSAIVVPGALSPVPSATPPPTPPPPPTPTPSPTVLGSTPTPATAIFGRVLTTSGGGLKGAQIVVYRADGFANGPTPVPPAVAHAVTDPDGRYLVAAPPGKYRVGAHLDEALALTLRVWPHAWHGGAYAIGLGKDVEVVAGRATIADIDLVPVFRVSGSVVGRDGAGVPNADVTTSRMLNVQYPIGDGTTDHSGAFSFTVPAMPMTLTAQVAGKAAIAWASRDLDVRGDVTGLRLTVDRGNLLTGTLRDAGGRPLANTNIGVTFKDPIPPCGGSCNTDTDSAGRFTLVVPSGTLLIHTWPRTLNEPMLYSKEYAISADTTLDVVVGRARD